MFPIGSFLNGDEDEEDSGSVWFGRDKEKIG